MGEYSRKKEGNIEKELAEIKDARPEPKWIMVSQELWSLTITLPHGCSVEGELDITSGVFTINDINVPDRLQKHGIGTRLLKTFTLLGIARGAKELWGYVTSESGLKNRARVFGAENLEFYDSTGFEKRKMDISYKEALSQIIEERNFEVRVDLAKISPLALED